METSSENSYFSRISLSYICERIRLQFKKKWENYQLYADEAPYCWCQCHVSVMSVSCVSAMTGSVIFGIKRDQRQRRFKGGREAADLSELLTT